MRDRKGSGEEVREVDKRNLGGISTNYIKYLKQARIKPNLELKFSKLTVDNNDDNNNHEIIIVLTLRESSSFPIFPNNCTLGQYIECLLWTL